MLLTLATRSLKKRMGKGAGRMSLLDMPDFAMRELQLRGLNIDASMLSGWGLEEMDALRDRADKAGCPCLVLVDDKTLHFADAKRARREAAADRMRRLGVAAHRLGCSAVAVRCEAPDNDDAFDNAATNIKAAMPPVERLELNVLLAPAPGLCQSPERLTELIKRIGGFRIGSMPDFAHAAASGDATEALRKLAPYAGAIHASVDSFTASGKHKAFSLEECVTAIRKVGFENTLAIEYIGDDDPVQHIDQARELLQAAIDEE